MAVELSLGWASEIAVLELTGTRAEVHSDHIVLRTPDNPGFHWGNQIVATGPTDAGPGPWLDRFYAAFPGADWVCIGLANEPEDFTAWTEADLPITVDDVLVSEAPPTGARLADGYRVHPLGDDDWDAWIELDLASQDPEETDLDRHRRFLEVISAHRRELAAAQLGEFFGAFKGTELAAVLGVVDTGGVARYQNVHTAPEHRRRGLAAHLVGVASRWTEAHGLRPWVILTVPGSGAERIYHRAGFEPVGRCVAAFRRPR